MKAIYFFRIDSEMTQSLVQGGEKLDAIHGQRYFCSYPSVYCDGVNALSAHNLSP